MEAKELRLGNWVRTPAGYEQVIDVMCDSINTMHYNGITYDDIEPIPLSPEILEKCGFEFVDSGYNDFKEVGVWYIDSFQFSQYLPGSYSCDFMYIYGDTGMCPLQYLHQLQNLFYSLTQNELNIKL